jgi:hypothetical protein
MYLRMGSKEHVEDLCRAVEHFMEEFVPVETSR